MIKRIALVTIVLTMLFGARVAQATPYGGSIYGKCAYQTSCPAPPATNPTPVGTPAPDTSPDPTVVASDVDKDGNNEQAIDADGNPANGYEKFVDPDGSSKALAETDGDHTGKTSFIIDINNDGIPDIYWSPSELYQADVRVEKKDGNIFWVFMNASHQLQMYLAGHTESTGAAAQGGNTTRTEDTRLTPVSFGGPVYQKVGELAKQVPAPVAYSFPYVLLGLLLLLTLRLLLQTRREFSRMKIIAATTEREKQLVLEKQNFLMLASHYLRTPITIIKGNIELVQSLKTIPEAALAPLTGAAAAIQTEIDALLEKITNDSSLNQIAVTQAAGGAIKKSTVSPFMLLPLIGLLLVGGFANFVFIDFRVTEPKAVDLLAQILLVVILGQWFISSFRRRHINKQNRLDQQKVLDEERSLDEARSNFIAAATQALTDKVTAFDQQLAALAGAGYDTSRLQKGFDQLKSIIIKFRFASSLRAASIEANKKQVDANEVVTTVTQRATAKAAAKNVTLLPQAEGGPFTQNQELLGLVLDSLTDNAIKYSPEKGEVKVNQGTDGQNVYFAVEDNGPGLTKEQLDILFKPFSRAESVETYNNEGLGFSLYLSRLIAHYLGGNITIDSKPNQVTVAQLSIPKA